MNTISTSADIRQQVLRGPGFEELNRSFTAYIRYIILARAQPQEALPAVTNLQEIAMLINEKPGLWARQWEKEGMQKGLLQGRQEGRREGRLEGRQEGRREGTLLGQAALLERLLSRKFGPLPEEITQRIRQGSSAELETWSLNFVDAETLDDVFDD